ncbi:MAG: hypothetical protein L6Q51_08245 [Cyclobacteriaceae bacterium]|nr:hypothetical protein [Cyclobacteriaceae bacterium]
MKLLITSPGWVMCQPVDVHFINRDQVVSTVMTGISDSHLLTTDEPIHLNNILALYFNEALPDSSTLATIAALDIYIYLNNK